MNELRSLESKESLLYSVILPAHRIDDYLSGAISSVEHAIGTDNAELIVVANGPNRLAIASKVLSERSLSSTRVEVSEIPSLIYCLNRGIDLAAGVYIARFDSDDICLKDRFRNQYQLALSSNADFIFSDAVEINAAGQKTGKFLHSKYSGMWKRCNLVHPTAFIKRESLIRLGGYGNIEYSEDYHLWLRALVKGYKFVLDRHPSICYRVHDQQATNSSKLLDTFATNIGMKITIGLRNKSFKVFIGATIDAAFFLVRKFRNYLS